MLGVWMDYPPTKVLLWIIFGSDHGSGVGDWRKGSADIKLLLKNLYSQSPMPHTDVTFKVICIIGNSIIIHCNFTVNISYQFNKNTAAAVSFYAQKDLLELKAFNE